MICHLESPNGGHYHGNRHPVPASMQDLRNRPGCRGGATRTRAFIGGGGGAIGQGTIDVDGLSAVHIDHTHQTGVLGHGAVEEGLVVGAVSVVVAATLGVLLAHTDNGERLVFVVLVIVVVVVVAVGVGIGAVQPKTREEAQCSSTENVGGDSSSGPGARLVGSARTTSIVVSSTVGCSSARAATGCTTNIA